jgi:hypothetical protein
MRRFSRGWLSSRAAYSTPPYAGLIGPAQTSWQPLVISRTGQLLPSLGQDARSLMNFCQKRPVGHLGMCFGAIFGHTGMFTGRGMSGFLCTRVSVRLIWFGSASAGPCRRTLGGQLRPASKFLSRPPAANGGGRRPAFTGLAGRPYSCHRVWRLIARARRKRLMVLILENANRTGWQTGSWRRSNEAACAIGAPHS